MGRRFRAIEAYEKKAAAAAKTPKPGGPKVGGTALGGLFVLVDIEKTPEELAIIFQKLIIEGRTFAETTDALTEGTPLFLTTEGYFERHPGESW